MLARRRRGEPVAADGPTEAPDADGEAELAPSRRGRRSRAGGVPARPDARAAGGARRSVDADLRRHEALHDGDAVPGGAGGDRARPAASACWPACCRRRARACELVAPAALAALVCLPAVVETRRSHPDGLSHYNLLAGGFAGGASLGMNRQFWGYSVLPMLDVINRDDGRESCDVLARRHQRCGLDVQARRAPGDERRQHRLR